MSHTERALLIPRDEAIKRVILKKDVARVVFSVMFHPAFPSTPSMINKGYPAMVEGGPRLKEIFPKPTGGLREKLIRAKVPPPPDPKTRSKRELK